MTSYIIIMTWKCIHYVSWVNSYWTVQIITNLSEYYNVAGIILLSYNIICYRDRVKNELEFLMGPGRQAGSAHTKSCTKLLYFSMFRLRISWQGPSTRSNLARSSLTHLRVPSALTVAARGLFNSRAISPEKKILEKRGEFRYKMWKGFGYNTHGAPLIVTQIRQKISLFQGLNGELLVKVSLLVVISGCPTVV